MSEGTYLSENFPFGEDVEKEGDNCHKRVRRSTIKTSDALAALAAIKKDRKTRTSSREEK